MPATKRQRQGQGLRAGLLAAAIAFAVGCAVVPKDAVDLSVTIGRDLAAVHRAHRELAIRYFNLMETDIQAFVDEVYRPFTIENTMTEFQLMDKIQAGLQPDAEVDALDVMDVYVTELMADLEEYRGQLLGPLHARRDQLLQDIDDSYGALQNGNAVVTGHLASVRKVHEEQDALLAKANLAGMRERFVDSTASLSDRIALTIEKGRSGEERIDAVAEALKQLFDDHGGEP